MASRKIATEDEKKRLHEIENAPFFVFNSKADAKQSAPSLYRDVSLSDPSQFRMVSGSGFPSLSRGLSGYSSKPVYRSVNMGASMGLIGDKTAFDELASIDIPNKLSLRSASKSSYGEPPEAPGGYLEKATTFCTAMKPEAAMEHLEEILKEMNIDFTLKPEKFKFKCEAYPRGLRLPFVVRIFSHEQKYAVEMQRRAGDCFCFSTIYGNFVEKCSQRGLCPKTKRISTKAPSISLPLDASKLDESINPLLKMAESEFSDVKAMAVAAISEMTTEKAVLSWFATRIMSHIALFEKLVVCSVQDVHRAAITCVANLTADKQLCKSFEKSPCIKTLVKMMGSENRQVARESSRALENLGIHLGKEALQTGGVSASDIFDLLKT